jgi:hypothetical protein
VLQCYEQLVARNGKSRELDLTPWDRLLTGIGIEWNLLVEKMSAAAAAVMETPATKAHLD